MRPHRSRLALLTVPTLLAALVLTGCTTASSGGDTAGDPGTTDPGTSDTGSSGTCSSVAQEGYELFTTDLVLKAPPEGFAYTAGEPIEWTLSVGAGYFPSLALSYVNEAGDAVVMGEQNLLDGGDGRYYNDLGVFDSDAAGRPGFATVRLVNDGSFEPPAGQESFDIADLGIYCISFGAE